MAFYSQPLLICYSWLLKIAYSGNGDLPVEDGDFPQLCKRLPEGRWGCNMLESELFFGEANHNDMSID